MSNFWERKLADIAQPAPQPAAPSQGGTAWWQGSSSQQQVPQGYAPSQPTGYSPALQAQMTRAGQQGPQGTTQSEYVNRLKSIPAEQLDQQQMEEIAAHELAHGEKYNRVCPSCGSGNFAPQGAVIGNKRLGSDKCFDCGASSSTYTSSPEPAVGGSKSSKAPYRDVRQIDTGGAGGSSMYLRFNGMPPGYMPRGG